MHAGVAWRLARQLSQEHSLAVRLWIDDPRSLARMSPGIDASQDGQFHAGIELRRWRETFAEPAPADADVVVEAFGCGLPEAYVNAMTRRSPAPVWFVLEYLSAESWIDGGHGLPSPHPKLPLTRRFWFPGFTSASGGRTRPRSISRDWRQRRKDLAARRWSKRSSPGCTPRSPRGRRSPRRFSSRSSRPHGRCPVRCASGSTISEAGPPRGRSMRTERNTVALHICSCPSPGLRRGRAITRVSFRSARKCHAVAESLAALAFVAWRQPNETRARTLFAESLVIRRPRRSIPSNALPARLRRTCHRTASAPSPSRQ